MRILRWRTLVPKLVSIAPQRARSRRRYLGLRSRLEEAAQKVNDDECGQRCPQQLRD
jgi:hypothetical protein